MRLPEFLQQKLKPKEGVIVEISAQISAQKLADFKNESGDFDIITVDVATLAQKPKYAVADGKIVGKHQGAHYFTKGQRKGLAVGGTPEPLFVIDTDVKENVIYTGQGKDHPGLYRSALYVKEEEIHWVRPDLSLVAGETLEVDARIRYRQSLEKAVLHKMDDGMYVSFSNPQSAISEGQFVAWYNGSELLGSGVIS